MPQKLFGHAPVTLKHCDKKKYKTLLLFITVLNWKNTTKIAPKWPKNRENLVNNTKNASIKV